MSSSTMSSKYPLTLLCNGPQIDKFEPCYPYTKITTPLTYHLLYVSLGLQTGKAEQFVQIRALLQEDKLRDQALAEQQQKQQEQNKMMGMRSGGVGSSSGQFSLKQPSALASAGNNNIASNNQQQSAKTPYTPSGSYSGGGGDTPTSSLDRRERQLSRLKENETAMKGWIEGLPPGDERHIVLYSAYTHKYIHSAVCFTMLHSVTSAQQYYVPLLFFLSHHTLRSSHITNSHFSSPYLTQLSYTRHHL